MEEVFGRMDKKLSDLLGELGKAINEAVWKSERIAAVLAALEEAGQDIDIEIDAALVDGGVEGEASPIVIEGPSESDGPLSLNATDLQFLRTLRIDGKQA
jgi:hypothetical protein